MTADYKKRAKAGYNTDKKSSNRSERVYEKEEIRAANSENSTLSKPRSKKKLSKLDKDMKTAMSDIRYFIKRYGSEESAVNEMNNEKRRGDDWWTRWVESRLSDFRKNKKLVLENRENSKLDKKISRQIPEILILLGEE